MNQITHVLYAFADIGPDGEVYVYLGLAVVPANALAGRRPTRGRIPRNGTMETRGTIPVTHMAA